MRYLRWLVFVLFLIALPLWAGTTSVTATITDSDGQTWNNGNFQAIFVPLTGTNPASYTVNGVPFTQQVKGTMNSSGTLSVSLTDLSTVWPTGGQWQFQLCPQASVPACSNVTTGAVSGGSVNLSTTLSNGVTAPRIAPSPTAYAYSDTEVVTTSASPGAQYYNVTSGFTRQWTGSAWQNTGGGIAAANIAPNQTAWYVSRNCAGQTNCTQVKADGKYVVDATSNSTTTVTCPNNDCNFTQADVGKTVWATTQGTTAGIGYLIYTTYVCPITTIATVNSAQSITLNATCTASGTANVALYWATDDGTALAGLDSTVGCSVVYLPDTGTIANGQYILTSQPFMVNAPASSVCLQQITQSVGSPAPALVGTGFGASQSSIMIAPNFAWANCKAVTGASLNVCLGGLARTLANLQIIGSGLTSASNSSGCAGAANKILVSASPGSSTIYGVDVAGVCPGASGMIGVQVNSFDENFDLGGVQEVGTIACDAYNAKSIVFREDDCHNVNVSGGIGLQVESGAQMMDLGTYPYDAVNVIGQLQSRGAHFMAGNGGSTAVTVQNGGIWLSYGDYVGVETFGGGTPTIAITVNSGGQALLMNTNIGASSSSVNNNGTVTSLGGNKVNAASGGTGTYLGTGILLGTCRGTATSSATLGLYNLGQNSTPACTSTTINQGQVVPIVPLSGSVFDLSVTAGTGCKSGNTCVFTVMKNNAANPSTPVATTITCSMVGPASTCNDSSHFDVPVAGDTYSIQFTTGATETLANVRATLVAW